MVNWDPVKGLPEIAYEDLQVGDEVVQLSFGENYTRTTIENPKFHGYQNKYWLLNREVKEPEGRGDLAKIMVRNVDDVPNVIEVYIRTCPKNAQGTNTPWTDSSNNVFKTWDEVLERLDGFNNREVWTYTATYDRN